MGFSLKKFWLVTLVWLGLCLLTLFDLGAIPADWKQWVLLLVFAPPLYLVVQGVGELLFKPFQLLFFPESKLERMSSISRIVYVVLVIVLIVASMFVIIEWLKK
jgi:hypothetical protein